MDTDRRKTTRDVLALAMLFSCSFAGTLAFKWQATPAVAAVLPQVTLNPVAPFQANSPIIAGMDVQAASSPEDVEASFPEPTLADLAASEGSAMRAEAQAVLGLLAEESQSL
jgi:hypothetical protein